mmetsp:Transcript_34192/g.105044  ORF Transcript_34192/g.105044 Transcript_34192/m.105044 type:complete len:385 (-) Transcript_34192:193-1347(-)
MGGVVSSEDEVSSLPDASVRVALEKTSYRAGETVRGYLQLTITRRTALTTMTVSLAGRAWTTVQYTDGGGGGSSSAHCTARENRHLLQMEAPVAHFPSGVCDPGHFQCPFEFQLPLDVPSSMAEHKSQSRFVSGDNVARLDYCVGVVVARPGWTKRNLVHRVAIDVVAAPPPVVSPARVDETVRVTRCCCIDAGVMRLGALMARNAYQGGEAPEVHYAVANDSSQDVMCVLCSLNQTISFTAGNHRQNLNSCLARVEMPAVAKGARFGFSVNGDGAPLATATLQLPAEFRAFSCETPTISVRHSVVVHSITKSSFVKDPKVQLPVTLYRLTPLPAAFLVAAPVDGGSDGLVPVAAPLPYAPQASSAAPARGVPVDTTGDGVADS